MATLLSFDDWHQRNDFVTWQNRDDLVATLRDGERHGKYSLRRGEKGWILVDDDAADDVLIGDEAAREQLAVSVEILEGEDPDDNEPTKPS